MILFNLAKVMLYKNISITKLHDSTGIARSTLTAMYYNQTKGFNTDTINAICRELKVEPNDIILYCPIDVELEVCKNEYVLKFHYRDNIYKYKMEFKEVSKNKLGIVLYSNDLPSKIILDLIPIAFITHIESHIKTTLDLSQDVDLLYTELKKTSNLV